MTPVSDVYSLGVLLYELLTGHRPYRLQGHTPHEFERVICEEDPQRPSTVISRIEEPCDGFTAITPVSVATARGDQPDKLRHRLAGDLDTIVLMALRKEPGQRYASVEELSEDLRRYLEGRPIRARNPTLAYRTAKLVGRNRATAFTAAIAITIILALAGVSFPWRSLWGRTSGAASGSASSLGNTTSSHVKSLAVLPFQPFAGNARDESLEFGIANALISKMNHVGQLTIRSSDVVRKYGRSGKAPQVAARELGVDTLLVGQIRQAGDRIHLSVQLISAPDNRVLWAETFDEPWAHILKIESAIATKVARALTLPVTTDERLRLAKFDTENPAAYREYLLGRHFWRQHTPAGVTTGLQHFARASELDPGYALAHAGMSDSYVAFASTRASSASDAYRKAKVSALRALELDPALPEAVSALAMVYLYNEWNWEAAELGFKRALAFNPNDGRTRLRYALALPYFDRFDDALAEIARARDADPLSPLISTNVGKILHLARRYREAMDEHRKALALDPNFGVSHNNLGLTLAMTGAYEQAIGEFQRAIDLGDSSEAKCNRAYAYAMSGRPLEARKILDELQARNPPVYTSPFDLAVAYTGLGDRDRAFSWLEKAYQERVRPMLSLRINPLFDRLHSDPRFAALVERMGVFNVGQAPSPAVKPR
jgi:tetratricopeptide (TPR) repeat protein/TolB-like protein